MSLLILDVLAASAFLACLYACFARGSSRPPLPPGPPADPLIGHTRKLPTENVAETFHEWSKIYGDVMYLKVLNREIIVLGSVEAARSLLEDKGRNYSCRPRFTVFELMGWNPTLVLMQYGKQFLKHRKMLQNYFGKQESLAFNGIFEEETKVLVKSLSHGLPGEHERYARQFTLSNIMRAAFGHRVKSHDDPFVSIAEGVTRALNNCGPAGNTPVDFFPWLRHLPGWFPGAYYATLARSYHGVVRKLHDVILDAAKNQENVGHNFTTDNLNELGDMPQAQDLEDIRGAAATVLAAGEDTSLSSVNTFFLASILHLQVQQRAYEEIISVVGEDRMPEIQDRESLPYVECVLQEVLRWHPVGPLGVPHRALQDDILDGMFIPKGAMVVANIRGMSMDERVYSNPKAFDPSRYLPVPEGKGEPKFTAVWGFGRRVCPGRHFADIVLWNAISCILATLELLPVKGQMPKEEFSEGLVSQALPFQFETRVRSTKAGELIAQIE